ncbi:murein transglycosylase A [Sphingomonas sp.]|uniref:murein transglycosylase A n=1 Tax=Sphingomonas sp. TaxID=28214 RepID=UPI002C500203|nr:murein transglycosylase A [Sphingomonas sp.]HTG37320.1 murein transglycosylase A [Sphingomonas sp.]
MRATWGRHCGGLALAMLASACSNAIVPASVQRGAPPPQPSSPRPAASLPAPAVKVGRPATPIAAVPAAVAAADAVSALSAGWVPGPAMATLPIEPAVAQRALAAFRTSCPSLQRRTDATGLTRGADWVPVCGAAVRASDATRFFRKQFETIQIADGKAFATGYYEPEIAGSRTRRAGYDTPVYGVPGDLVEVDLTPFATDLAGRKIRGRIENGRFLPYPDRTAIENGALAGRGLEIAWAADPVELFFLQVQGSGRLRLPDGGVMRIGYAGQNGRPYTGIGALMRDRGLLAPGQASMQGIMAWLRAHPEEGRAIMRENKSVVFFRELTGPGPLGAMGLPVTGRTSIAADPRFVPLGAPVFLSMDRADANGIWIAQDTGGAIKGANRFDTFWGAGAEARAIAGGMSARGTAFILVPRGTLSRLAASGRTPARP